MTSERWGWLSTGTSGAIYSWWNPTTAWSNLYLGSYK